MKLKAVVKYILDHIFRRLPLSLAKWIFRKIPRLSVCAPPGIVYECLDYLGEFRVRVDTTYPIEKKMLTGIYEPVTIMIIDKFVSSGDVCFDIGANVGAITLALAQKTTSGGRVFAFEPGPPIYDRLVQNLFLNPQYKDTIIAENLGVADRQCQLLWHEDMSTDGRGNGGLLHNRGVSVDVTSLDIYCKARDLNRLDFIKIDVEGMEFEVLKGAREVISLFKPNLFFETLGIFDRHRGSVIFNQIEEYLANLNYHLFSVNKKGEIRQINKIGVEDHTLACPINSRKS